MLARRAIVVGASSVRPSSALRAPSPPLVGAFCWEGRLRGRRGFLSKCRAGCACRMGRWILGFCISWCGDEAWGWSRRRRSAGMGWLCGLSPGCEWLPRVEWPPVIDRGLTGAGRKLRATATVGVDVSSDRLDDVVIGDVPVIVRCSGRTARGGQFPHAGRVHTTLPLQP